MVTEAYGDAEANPPGSYAACRTAEEVYELIGSKEDIGWHYREGKHAHLPEDYDALLDFLDWKFRGELQSRNFRRELYPDLDEILT